MFKPCKDLRSLVVLNNKFFKVFGFGFFVNDVVSGVCFAVVCDAIGQCKEMVLWLKSFIGF